MSDPSKCISTAEMFFLKAFISAEWHKWSRLVKAEI